VPAKRLSARLITCHQQTLKPDDYVLPHQRIWMFDILVCPLSVTERFLLQPLVCGTVFHCTSLLTPSLSIFCCCLKSRLFLLSYPRFLTLLSFVQCPHCDFHLGHFNRLFISMIVYICQVLKLLPNAHVLACAPSNAAADLLAERLLEHLSKKSDLLRMCAYSRDSASVPATIKVTAM